MLKSLFEFAPSSLNSFLKYIDTYKKIYKFYKAAPPIINNSLVSLFYNKNSLFEADFKSILGLFYASLWLKQSLLGLWRASEAFLASLDLLRPIYGLCKAFL